MPRGKKVRVKMTGTTVWTIRPGDEIMVDEKMAKRWERGKMATILVAPEEAEELSLAQLREICKANSLPIRGTKAEVEARIVESGKELKMPEEEELPFYDPELEDPAKDLDDKPEPLYNSFEPAESD